MQEDYNKTLNLPKTDFSMRAGLPAKEPVMLAQWLADDLYHEIVKSNEGKPLYVLHDGPPSVSYTHLTLPTILRV